MFLFFCAPCHSLYERNPPLILMLFNIIHEKRMQSSTANLEWSDGLLVAGVNTESSSSVRECLTSLQEVSQGTCQITATKIE